MGTPELILDLEKSSKNSSRIPLTQRTFRWLFHINLVQGLKQENQHWNLHLLSLLSVSIFSSRNWTIAINLITCLISSFSILLPPVESGSFSGESGNIVLVFTWSIFSLSYRRKLVSHPTPSWHSHATCILFSACVTNLSFNDWLLQSSLLLEKSSHFYFTILLSPGMFFLQFFSIPLNIQITANIVLLCAHFTC